MSMQQRGYICEKGRTQGKLYGTGVSKAIETNWPFLVLT